MKRRDILKATMIGAIGHVGERFGHGSTDRGDTYEIVHVLRRRAFRRCHYLFCSARKRGAGESVN